MGLSPGAWLDMTPHEFDNYRKGYIRRIEATDRMEWVRTRWLGWIMIKTVDVKDKFKTAKDVFEFEWERADRKELESKLKRAEKYLPKTRKELDAKKWVKVGKRG